MAVPEQDELFLQWPRSVGHTVQPPAAQFQHPFALDSCLLLLQLPLVVRRAVLIHVADSLHLFRVGFRPGRRGRRVGNGFVIEQGGNRPVQTKLVQLLDFHRRAAETCAVQQMRRRRVFHRSDEAA